MSNEAPEGTAIPRVLSPEEALRAVENAQAPAAKTTEKAANPLAQEEYEFECWITDGAGRKVGGLFANKILSGDQRIKVGLIQRFIVGGVPWSSLDPDTQYLVQQAAHLQVSLSKKPEFFKPLEMKNPRLADKVYAEVAKHETYFRGSDPTEESGA